MTAYCCPRCGYTTQVKSNLRNHFNRKKECEAKASNVPFNTLLQKYVAGDSFEADLDKPNNIQPNKSPRCMEIYYDKLQAENAELKAELKATNERLVQLLEVLQKLDTKNVNNNITINLTIRPFGTPSTEHITEDFKKECLTFMNKGILNLVKEIHFNPNVPENHNILCKSTKNGTCQIWNGVAWEVKPDVSVFDDLISISKRILFDCFVNLRQSDEVIKSLDDVLNSYFLKLGGKTKEFYNLRKTMKYLVKEETPKVLQTLKDQHAQICD